MKITRISPTTVTVPLEAPILHSNGAHWGRFVRTIIEVETDEGITGIGEMGGGGESAEAAFVALEQYLLGHDPFQFELLRHKIANPTASLYNNRTQLLAALEFACLDIAGKALGVPVYNLLGGKVRDEVRFASYLFFRDPNEMTGEGEIHTAQQMVDHAQELKARYGFTSHKLKGGVFPPEYEADCYLALASEFPGETFRFDPNAAFSVGQAIKFADRIAHVDNDYLEDPTWGLNGMRQVREATPIPLATNTVVIGFEQLATNVRDPAVDVILLDTTFWGGVRACIKAANVCETFQTGIAIHSSGELGIQLSTMLHLGAVLPNLTFSADAHYHHLVDDVIVGGKMEYVDGKLAVPEAPGLGVDLDRDRLDKYARLYQELGGYMYDRDPKRPGWFSMVPKVDGYRDPYI